jgi:hypothetical protein
MRYIPGLLAALLTITPAFAQLGAPSGPGQAVDLPPAQCPATVACSYAERNMLPDGYRFQQLEVCGANCTTQYWVTTIADGRVLVEIDPVRGGGIMAVGKGDHPPVRTVLPDYAPSDPACCPSGYADTTYTWDDASGSLVAADPVIVPASSFEGWDKVRTDLQTQLFTEVFH